MAGVTIDRISKVFGAAAALDNVSLSIKSGEFITLLGPSGCGKSTLLRIVAGLAEPSDGRILIGDRDVSALSPRDRGVAMVFQSYALYPHMTVGGNIAAPLLLSGLTAWQRAPFIGRFFPGYSAAIKKIKAQVLAVSDTLGITHLLDRKPSQISGGQRQRVALGRAMVRNPDVFLMDEPLANLDAALRAHMRSELTGLHRRLGTTFIYVTHDQLEAMTMSDRIVVIFQGVIRQVGTPAEIFRDPADEEVASFMSQPKMNRLKGQGRGTDRVEVAGIEMEVACNVPRGASVTVAFRPESGRISLEPTNGCLEVQVDHAELMGTDALVYLVHEALPEQILVRVDADLVPRLRPGTTVWVAPDARTSWCFDADGRRLRNKAARVAA